MTLVLVKKGRTTALYRTVDGQYEIVGVDLNCTGPAARAAGAGPVWWWLVTNSPTKSHAFSTRARCVADLKAHLVAAKHSH
jgi:hypothetical protein